MRKWERVSLYSKNMKAANICFYCAFKVVQKCTCYRRPSRREAMPNFSFLLWRALSLVRSSWWLSEDELSGLLPGEEESSDVIFTSWGYMVTRRDDGWRLERCGRTAMKRNCPRKMGKRTTFIFTTKLHNFVLPVKTIRMAFRNICISLWVCFTHRRWI